MTYALSETQLYDTNPVLGPSCFQQWTFLTTLNRHLQSFLEGKLESFDSNVDTSTGVNRMDIRNDFWNAPHLCFESERRFEAENDSLSCEESECEISEISEGIAQVMAIARMSEQYEQILDWDTYIEDTPQPSQSGTINVRFICMGRSKPVPIDDPTA